MAHWVRYSADGRSGFGVLVDEGILEHEGDMFGIARGTGRTIDLRGCTIESPCIPGKIIGLWNNFHALAAKLGKAAPGHPLWFIKPASSVIGPGRSIVRPPGYGGKILFEGELGIVIGKICTRVSLLEAQGHIFGYTCVNDVTAADLLNENADFVQWTRAKSFDTFSCLGPAIATHLDVAGAHLVTRLAGSERQNYPLSDMIFNPVQIVSRLSHDMTLLPGDVIACGTSLGVGSIKDGNEIEITISGLGSLRNTLIAA